jgi:hypothetical protein
LLRHDLTPGVPDESRMDLQYRRPMESADDLPNLSSIEFLRSRGSNCLVVTTSAPITSLVANGKKHHMLMCGTVAVVLHLSSNYITSYGRGAKRDKQANLAKVSRWRPIFYSQIVATRTVSEYSNSGARLFML